MNPEQQNPFQRIDEALERDRHNAAVTGKKTVKHAEMMLRGARKAEAELLKPERTSDRILEAQNMPFREKWSTISASLEKKIEQISIRMGESGLDDTEKAALWSRFKNMVRYNEKIDAALAQLTRIEEHAASRGWRGAADRVPIIRKEYEAKEAIDKQLTEDPLHVYALGMSEVEDEVLLHRERDAAAIKAHADKLETALDEYRKIEEHVADLEKPRNTAGDDKLLEQRIELATELIKKLDKAKKFFKRAKEWVDGSPEGEGLDAKSIVECAPRMSILMDEWRTHKTKNVGTSDNEEDRMIDMRFSLEQAALQKRLEFHVPDYLGDTYDSAKNLIDRGIVRFNQAEMRQIELLSCLKYRAPSPKDLPTLSSDGKTISLTEEEAKLLAYNWKGRIFDLRVDFPLIRAIRKYRNRDWYKAMEEVRLWV